MPVEQKTICPHLGLVHDPATHMNFPSVVNQCQNCKKPQAPRLAYQGDFCLSHAHTACILNRTRQKISMPPEIGMLPTDTKRIHWIAIVLSLLVGFSIFFLYRASSPDFDPFLPGVPQNESVGIQGSPTETLLSPANTIITGMVTTPPVDEVPTGIHPPSETPVNSGTLHIYEATKLPPGASHGFLIHIVAQGETLDIIAFNFGTTVQAIMSVNYDLTPPVWVDYPIVIPVNTDHVSGMPAFEVYVVEDYETISSGALAGLLAVNSRDLEFYNLCSGACQYNKGDVLLIPHSP